MSDTDFVYHDPDDVPQEEEETELEVEEEEAGEELELQIMEDEDHGDEMATIIPRKWRGFGSELEVNQEKVTPTRPPITLTVHRLRKHFGDECNFQNSDPTNIHMFASFESQDPSVRPFIHRKEIDRGIQVRGPSVDCSTQTGLSFKRNKMVQSSIQTLSDENVEILMNSKSMAYFFKAAMPKLEKSMQQNEMVDLLFNDYKNLKAKHGHELEFQRESSVAHPDDMPPEEKSDSRNMDWMRQHKLAGKERIELSKKEELAQAEEIEQEERLNKEYVEFLKFQAEVVEILKVDEPQVTAEDQDMADEFEALIREAQMQQAQEEADAAAALLAEEEEEEEEEEEQGTTIIAAT